MADLAEDHTWRDTFADAAFSIAMPSKIVGNRSIPYSPLRISTKSMLGTGFAGPAPTPVSIVTLEERLLEFFEAYDLNERKTVDIVLGDSAIVVRFSINALPGKSLEEGLLFDNFAASFLSLFGSWLRHLTEFLTHIVDFASQSSQLSALILMVAIFLCCILFLAVRQ